VGGDAALQMWVMRLYEAGYAFPTANYDVLGQVGRGP
jgi:hypothetical protein